MIYERSMYIYELFEHINIFRIVLPSFSTSILLHSLLVVAGLKGSLAKELCGAAAEQLEAQLAGSLKAAGVALGKRQRRRVMGNEPQAPWNAVEIDVSQPGEAGFGAPGAVAGRGGALAAVLDGRGDYGASRGRRRAHLFGR